MSLKVVGLQLCPRLPRQVIFFSVNRFIRERLGLDEGLGGNADDDRI